MKYAIAFPIAAAFALSAAYANHHEGKGDEAGMKAKMEAKFNEADVNSDGAVSEQEFVNYVTAKAKAEFAEMAGDDMSLTMAEMESHHKAKKAAMKDGHKMDKMKSGEQ